MDDLKRPLLPTGPTIKEDANSTAPAKSTEDFKKPLLPTAPTTKEDGKSTGPAISIAKEDVQKPAVASPYKVPIWSNVPSANNIYSFEVLKSGKIIGEYKNLQNKAFWTFGRLPENDIELAHLTISRFHAVLQYRSKSEPHGNPEDEADAETEQQQQKDVNSGPPEGWYIYDLGSTHGTFLNKQRLPPKVYIRIKVGHMLRLGASTRSFILQGPPEDEEPESELSITELKAKRQHDMEEAALAKKRLQEEAEERARNEGCSWGMGEDAEEETDLTHNPFASTNNEDLFLDDPKKTLRGYFEREGLQLEYRCDEMSAGSFVCRVELPLDNENGRPIVAEVVHKGKKKDCVVQCALEACRILDRHGVLRQANQEPLKRKLKTNDSGSDDDEFWDRTGDVARKKQRKAAVATSVTLTYEDLLKKENVLNKELEEVLANITLYQEQQRELKAQKEKEATNEDLDSFMENLNAKDVPKDKTEIKKLRLEEQRLKSEIQRNAKLIKIAKPVDLPLSACVPTESTNTRRVVDNSSKHRQMPMIGKRNQFSKFKIVKPLPAVSASKPKASTSLASDEEEIEEDDVQAGIDNDKIENQTNEKTEDVKDPEISDVIVAHAKNSEMTIESNTTNSKETSKQRTISESETETDQSDCLKPEAKSEVNPAASLEQNKKRRHRIRQRGKRQDIDIEDEAEYEATDKYAKWVPPENQTGDGFTELNKKYGY